MRFWSVYLSIFINGIVFSCHLSKNDTSYYNSCQNSGLFKMKPLIWKSCTCTFNRHFRGSAKILARKYRRLDGYCKNVAEDLHIQTTFAEEERTLRALAFSRISFPFPTWWTSVGENTKFLEGVYKRDILFNSKLYIKSRESH